MNTSTQSLHRPCSLKYAAFSLFGKWSSASVIALLLAFGLTGSKTHGSTIADWRFEPGNMTADSSGNGNNLTLNNVTSSTDVATNAPAGTGTAVFDGSTSYAVTTGNLDLTEYFGLTFECFIKTNGQSSLGIVCEHTANNSLNPGGFFLDFNEVPGEVKVCQYQYTGFETKVAPYPADSGWHHYAVTMDETGAQAVFRIYIDGVEATNSSGSSPFSINNSFTSAPFYLGARGGVSFFFNGQIGEFRISSKVLPPSGFLIVPPLKNALIQIMQQPTNVTVIQNSTAVFSVAATLQNGNQGLLEYQWQTNGFNIPGATSSTYIYTTLASLAQSGTQFSVVVSVQSVSGVAPVTSSAATLTVMPDTTPPLAVAAYSVVNTMASVMFNELLDPVSANDPASYSLDGGTTVQSAQLQPDGRTVVLGVSGFANPTHVLSYNIADLVGNFATNTIIVTNANLYSIADIGAVPAPGVVIATNPTSFTVIGGGSDIWTSSDGFDYLYTPISGNFDVRLQVQNIAFNATDNVNTRGGLMVREDTTPGSRNIFIGTYELGPNNYWLCTTRSTTGGTTAIIAIIDRGAGFNFPNAWVRLKSVGQTFTAYYSTNDIDWTPYGTSMTPNPAYSSNVLIGIGSDSVSTTQTATFQYGPLTAFSLTSGNIAITSQPTNTTVTTYHGPAVFTIAAVLQPTNHPDLLAYQWFTNGVAVSDANGTNYTITAADLSLAASGTQVRCVVSAPGIASVGSSNATLTVTPNTNPPVALYAYSIDGTTVQIGFDELLDPTTATDPSRYTINGGGVSINQATLGAGGQSVQLLTSGGLSAPTFNVAFTNIADLSGNLASGSITGTNAGFTVQDIGAVAGAGSLLDVGPSGFTVSAYGADIWGNNDSFNFIYKPLTNNFDVRLQMDGIPVAANAPTRGGLMARLDTTAGSPNVFVGTYSPMNPYWAVTERNTEDAATPLVAYVLRSSNFAFPNAWLRLQRSGQTITAFDSTDGFNWTPLGIVTDIFLPDVLLVGIASVSVYNNSASQFQYSNFGNTILIPQLQIVVSNGDALISWPASALGFQLQQTTQLGAGAAWTKATNATVQIGSDLEVTVPITTATQFYRLVH